MEKTKDKRSKKGKNKEKKNSIQPTEDLSITFGSWNQRVSALRWQNEAAMSAGVNIRDTAKHQQSVMAPSCQAQSGEKPQLTKRGQAEKGDINPKQPETGPKYRILKRQPEDAPQQRATPEGVATAVSTDIDTRKTANNQQSFKAPTGRAQSREKPQLIKKYQAQKGDLNSKQSGTGPSFRILKRQPEDAPQQLATPEGVPRQGVTTSSGPQRAAASEDVPQQAGTPGATQPACEATELTRGPVQRKTLWTPPPPYRTPLREHSGAVKATELKRGPVQEKTLRTVPHQYTPQAAPAKPQLAGRVDACVGVEISSQQAMFYVPEPELQQPICRETRQTIKKENEGLAAVLEPFNEAQVKVCDGVKASPQQTMIYVPEPGLQQLRCRETEQTIKENEGLSAVLESFNETQVKVCDGVKASPQQTMIYVPEPELQQLRETEQTIKENEGLSAVVESFKETQVKTCDEVKASPQQTTIYVPEPELQQLRNEKMEQTTKLTKDNEALKAEMEQLKETLQRNKALHDEAQLKREINIMDLELQLSEKRATEAEALCKVQQMQEALQKQREIQKELDVCLAQQIAENDKLKVALTQTQRELECQQLQWQEERSRLLQTLNDIHHTLQEEKKARDAKCNGVMDRTVELEERIKTINKKSKKPSLRKRFLQLFK